MGLSDLFYSFHRNKHTSHVEHLLLYRSHEGFGIVYLEAAASGVPSLAARLAGAVEAIDEGRSGFFVEQPDVTSISNAITRFLSGEVNMDAEECRNFARNFSWVRVADIAEKTYRQIFVQNLHS